MSCWLCGSTTDELVTTPKSPPCKDGPCKICIQVMEVDEEINQTFATLRRLFAKRCDLRSEQNRTHDFMHRLPIELTNYVFELFLPTRDEWGGVIWQRNTPATPSYLTSICRGWRDIALSNPLLWSTIHIMLGKAPTSRRSDPPRQIDFFRDRLLRSRALPLTIHVCVSDEFIEDEWRDVVDTLSQCSNRWHSLFLEIQDDIPTDSLNAFHHVHCDQLRRLRIVVGEGCIKHLPPLFSPKVSPAKIDTRGLSFQPLQISLNQLSSATVECFDLEEVVQLFRSASQMTECHIRSPRYALRNFSMPSIIHQRLQTLGLSYGAYSVHVDAPTMILGSLTLPCLQEFRTNVRCLLTPAGLPSLVHRSSSPLSRLVLLGVYETESEPFDDLQPLVGVTDLILETLHDDYEKLLLEGYFPNLRHLTLRLHYFLQLWDTGIIHKFLGLKRRGVDAPNEGKLLKLLVIGQNRAELDAMWKSRVGKKLKALNICLREDGFEILWYQKSTS